MKSRAASSRIGVTLAITVAVPKASSTPGKPMNASPARPASQADSTTSRGGVRSVSRS